MMPTILRLGDTQTRSEEAIELVVKTSKCTALARPKGWKRFARRKRTAEEEAEAAKMDIDEDNATFRYSISNFSAVDKEVGQSLFFLQLSGISILKFPIFLYPVSAESKTRFI